MVRVSQMTLAHDRHGPQLVYNCGRVRFQGLSQRSVMALMGKSGLIVVRVAVEWGQPWKRTDAQTTCGHNRPGNSCGKAVRFIVERSKIGGEFLGQHRKYLGNGVDRGGVLPRMIVKCRVLLDDSVHVGIGDKDL